MQPVRAGRETFNLISKTAFDAPTPPQSPQRAASFPLNDRGAASRLREIPSRRPDNSF